MWQGTCVAISDSWLTAVRVPSVVPSFSASGKSHDVNAWSWASSRSALFRPQLPPALLRKAFLVREGPEEV